MAPGGSSNLPVRLNPRARAKAREARLLLVAVVLAACSSPLPDEGSASAELYRKRCGSCHRLYQPGSLKFPLWEPIVARMETHIRRNRQPPIDPAEKEMILAYLRQHAAP
jgi:hypothetical protein